MGRRSSCKCRCVKVLWRKRGAKAAYCCNLATGAKILDELYLPSTNLGLAFAVSQGEIASFVVPIALFALFFKLAGTLTKYGLAAPVAARPSEAVEFYMYFFIFAYLIVVERRILALAAESRGDGTEG